MAADATEFAIQILRNQLGRKVYPVHRLDRKTSGILVFALNEVANRYYQTAFMNREVHKVYHAIVRGYTEAEGCIDYPLENETGKKQEAVTRYKTLENTQIRVEGSKWGTERYSFVEIYPETGRMHQIRKHFKHIFHPIIGDRPYGCNKQNRFFLEKWNLHEMLLHSRYLKINTPPIEITACYQPEFRRIYEILFGTKPDIRIS
jgi:tRNA pseudouridine65 synthase